MKAKRMRVPGLQRRGTIMVARMQSRWLGSLLLCLCLLGSPMLLARSADPDWTRVEADLARLHQDAMPPGEREAGLQAMLATLPDARPYRIQRELALVRIRQANRAESIPLMQALRQLALAHGDGDTADLMEVREIFATHDDDDIEPSLTALDAVHLRIGPDAPLALREAIESSYAFMYWDIGGFELALRHMLRSRELVADLPGHDPERVARRSIQVARLHLEMQDPDAAGEVLDGIRLAPGTHPSAALSTSIAAVRASALRQLQRHEEAAQLLQEALSAPVDASDQKPLLLHTELVKVLLAAGKDRQALESASAMLALARAGSSPWFLSEALVLHGQVLARNGQLQAGLAQMQQGIDYFADAGHVTALEPALARKVEVLREAGRFEQALDVLQQRNDLAMRMLRNNRALGVASLQMEQQQAARERRIGELSSENALQAARLREQRMGVLVMRGMVALALVLLVLLGLLLRSTRREREALWRDALTGTYIRPRLAYWLDKHPLREGRERWVLLLDLDDFKQINDQHGHARGDGVLVEAGKRLRSVVADHGELFRWGGEEFLAVIETDRDDGGIAVVAQALLHALAKAPMSDAQGGHPLMVTGSLGGTRVHPADATLTNALAWADAGLYQAKSNGRRGGVLAGPVASGASPAPPPRNPEELGQWVARGQAWERRIEVPPPKLRVSPPASRAA